MIRDFWAQNYLSIRDKQGISFVSKSKDEFLNVEIAPGVYLNKLGILYGANASGKSNMLYAIQGVFKLLYVSRTDINDKVISWPPFELTKDNPIKMFVSFYADSVRYDYNVEYCSDHIINESFLYYPNGSKSLFYRRTYRGQNVRADIKFGKSLKMKTKTQNSIKENTLNNHSVLSTFRKVSFDEDIQPIAIVFRWIEKYVHDINGDSEKNIVEELSDVFHDKKRFVFYKKMLKKADLNISSFRPIAIDKEVPQKLQEMVMQNATLPDVIKRKLLKSQDEDILFINNSKNGDFEISMRLQSKGTSRYLTELAFLYDLITDNHIYLLDELGEDLHYDLLLYYLNVFIYNSDKSQLIFTSQETALLAEDLLNEHRDLVWFVEKDHDTASSQYSRGDSFGLHKNLSLYNSYKIGRLGAKPELGSPFIDFETE